MKPTIRLAESSDIPEIQRLYRQLDGHHAESIPEVFQSLEEDAREEGDIQEAIDRAEEDLLLAICDERVVGFVHLQIANPSDFPVFRSHRFALMDSAIADKPCRGKGIGRMLCNAAIEWCKNKGVRQIQTNVWNANEGAREFYLDFGFLPICVKLELSIQQIPEDGGKSGTPT